MFEALRTFLIVYYITQIVIRILWGVTTATFWILVLLVTGIYKAGESLVKRVNPNLPVESQLPALGGIGALATVFLAIVGIGIVAASMTPSKPAPASPTAAASPSSSSMPSSSSDHASAQPAPASSKVETFLPSSSSSPSSSSDEKLRAATQAYYEAVDRGDWNYTYDHLDSQTQHKFTKDEWVQKNQFFANQCPGEQSTPKIGSGSSSSEVNVAVTLTFKGCPTKYRTTSFVNENGDWKHRFLKEELDLFMPGTSYDKFVKANS